MEKPSSLMPHGRPLPELGTLLISLAGNRTGESCCSFWPHWFSCAPRLSHAYLRSSEDLTGPGLVQCIPHLLPLNLVSLSVLQLDLRDSQVDRSSVTQWTRTVRQRAPQARITAFLLE